MGFRWVEYRVPNRGNQYEQANIVQLFIFIFLKQGSVQCNTTHFTDFGVQDAPDATTTPGNFPTSFLFS